MLLIVGTALAQLDTVTENFPPPEDTWQTMTDVDTWWISSSWGILQSGAIVLLSGEIQQNTGSLLSTGEVFSGTISNQKSDPIPRLMLSEVYYDGTDEWIEITNMGEWTFQWNITLVGVKSTPLTLNNISFLSGESKLFGDTLSQVSGTQYIAKTGLALNLTDTAAINIQLIVSGQVEDVFLVDQYRVNKYNDKKTSFEKIGPIPTRVQNPINNQTGYIITPGRYVSNWIVTDVSFPPQQSSGSLQSPIPCVLVDQRDLAKVNEIFPGNEKYPAYIELAIHDNITLNTLSISGDYLSTGVEFLWDNSELMLEKNTLLLLSSTGFRQNEGVASLQNSWLNQLGTWHWIVITFGSWQSRRVMDIVYLSGDSWGKSYYFAKTSQQCVRVLDAIDDFSPGFDQKFLKFFSGTTITKIEYLQATTGSQISTGSCQSSGQVTAFSWEMINSTNNSGIINNYIIHILSVDYDPEGSDTNNEKVTLLATSKLGWSNPLDLNSVFRLTVNGTNKTLPRSLPMDIPTTFTKTFWFPNSSDGQTVVIQLTYGDYVFDTYTYNPNLPDVEEEKKIETGDTELSWTFPSLSWLSFFITYVLPNPKWSDKFEELGIKVSSTQSRSGEVDLGQWFSLHIGKTTKKIKGIMDIGQEYILSWSLWLVNKAACVSLVYQDQELTKFCYEKPKEGQKIFSSDQWLATTSEENIQILNTLQLKKIGTDLCIWYKDKALLCKHIPAGKAAIKTTQEQKMYKWFTSLIKQYILTNWKDLYYSTPIKTYYDLVAKNKKLIASWVTYVDIYGQSIAVTDIKKQLQVQEKTLPWVIAVFIWIQALYQ